MQPTYEHGRSDSPQDADAGLSMAGSVAGGLREPDVVMLGELPVDHQLRKRTLGEVKADCRNKKGKEWKNVARWVIAASSYNDLGSSWTDTSEFRAPTDPLGGRGAEGPKAAVDELNREPEGSMNANAMNAPQTAEPIALLVANICNVNNGGIEQVGAFLATQPLIVRAQFIARCASLIEAAAQKDSERYAADDLRAYSK